jgi:hypothetical protein
MAKAHLKTADGTTITIEGTPDEVTKLVHQLEIGVKPKPVGKKAARQRTQARTGPAGLLAELIDGGFFKKPKELSAIKLALEEQGHYYPLTSLSPVVLRLVRKRDLRRIRDKKRWLYVGG